jgi:23S rRNA (guanosine2251-2'-O)-methyltransferase
MVRKHRNGASAAPDMLYGHHPVMEALMAGRRTIRYLMIDRRLPSERQARLVALADEGRIPVKTGTPDDLVRACGSDQHQGVVMAASPLPLGALDPLVARAVERPSGKACLLVLLDSIVDPHNLGAIVRSAHCAGVDALVIPKDRAAGATPAVSKASAGALEHVQLCQVTNLAVTIDWLKAQGIWVAGLAREGAQTLYGADLAGPLALVIGGEEKGLRPLVRKRCDYLVSIPMCGRVDSLNASAAAAVALYEAYRQRHTD